MGKAKPLKVKRPEDVQLPSIKEIEKLQHKVDNMEKGPERKKLMNKLRDMKKMEDIAKYVEALELAVARKDKLIKQLQNPKYHGTVEK